GQGGARGRCRRSDECGAGIGLLVPGAVARAHLRWRCAQRHQVADRPLLHRHHAAQDRRGRAQEPARHLHPDLQLVAGCQPWRIEMRSSREIASASMLSIALGACATRVQVPEIPILDSPAFAAARAEPDPKPEVRYVEVPRPLPLPGQLKPVTKSVEKAKEEPPPKERVSERVTGANAAARIEPVKDGYINAIQVYPYS